ncbi:MAG: YihY/virulence factor BrkB family protein [Mesorhizobium sp.]|nr:MULTISPECIES: YihY/virulence factor BrkB family protein [unclassified Mesorhizobium]RVD21114.1 YihY/virulence factor BrkB family protein [Mesorhizobium sp. M4B.F.Ca.ET.017.02.2.1]RWA60961.1 MAG: YihY/virulence factor BrkB family protein [Mesorhizobium sp.]
MSMIWALLKESATGFVNDNALSRGAALAFYAATSLAPILLIVVAISGIAIGHQAAELALSAQISGLMGSQSAELFRATLESASNQTSGTWAALAGLVTLIATASGVFGEMQLALNTIWKVPPTDTSLSRMVRARAASLGLVGALGFLLLVSLIASAAISALAAMLNAYLPFGETIASVLNTVLSFILTAVLFAAIYKVLPDRSLAWRDVGLGALVTAALFTVGKSAIGWYLGASTIASSYGAAGGLIVTLLWVYYSSQIFLFGAELTRAYSIRRGTRPDLGPVVAQAVAAEKAVAVAEPEQPSRGITWVSILISACAGSIVALMLDRDRRADQ